MPKEITYSSDPAFMRREDGSEVLASEQPPGTGQSVIQRGVHVGWSRMQHVEIGVSEFDRSTESPYIDAGMFTSLEREGINRLIRSLRKARDQAFGQDA